jgi:hypothetical protein
VPAGAVTTQARPQAPFCNGWEQPRATCHCDFVRYWQPPSQPSPARSAGEEILGATGCQTLDRVAIE